MVYPANYSEATRLFTEAADAAGATVARHAHPHRRAPDGGPLEIVAAQLGPPGASRALLSISGTHGLEACSGSAAQSLFLGDRPALPADTAIVLVHCLNPFGFAWHSRCNEDFVDLSRNFIADWGQPPDNPYYAEIHALLTPSSWPDDTDDRLNMAIARLTAAHGVEQALTGLTGGQYGISDGLGFGGCGSSWSRRTFEAICRDWLGQVARLGYIDFHTGFGAFAEPFFVCLHPPDSPARARAERWWGPINDSQDAFGIGAVPQWQGLLWDGLRRWILPDAEICGSVIEFGTYALPRVARALMADRWLRFEQDDAALRARVRAEMIEAFAPAAPEWRARVADRGRALQHAALAGLADW
ncbi:MAG: hypothetical protein ABS87_00325 [Sphingomonas sp. SCN 67-18]|uniref:DUF2817 domain-containing protein n=1 Tax=uncultured Sphingomonas sp. TaxID=158754 RepID=UPI00086F8CC3|nr:DUF2817 domain-containing protein [Sphingomonas sp. SCN 67-18]ODU22882.1 MAG: hypothetical protein ABS87_00325 [Sphingomonas sp. SCN 67-18]